MKVIKMGMDGSADAFSFGLIAMAQVCQIVRNDYDAPMKFDHFYQKYEVINKAIEQTVRKLDMVPNNERRTQIITTLHNMMEKEWNYVRKRESKTVG